MLKFFRKIRFDLMEKNKTGKYLTYAFGEIILVVIGILIALQINNANEDRKDRALEMQYLSALKIELEKDVIKSESAISGNEILLEGVHDLLELLASSTEGATHWRKIYAHSVKDTYWYMAVDYSESTLGQLVHNGGIQLVKDSELANTILEYEQGLIIYKNQYAFLKQYFHEMEETQKNLFDLRLARKAFLYIEEDHSNMLKPVEEFYDLIEIGEYVIDKDPKLQSNYYGDVLFYESNLKYLNYLLEEQQGMAVALIALIDAE